jgi:hypothetical protein
MKIKRNFALLVSLIFLLVLVIGCKPAKSTAKQTEKNYRYTIVLPQGYHDTKTDAYEFVVGTGGVTLPCIKYVDSEGISVVFCGSFKIDSNTK